ncbi:multisubunit potassium/proton antiporter, PhaA subunit /multisubunit potassium/proton antiporter, PhaB subunit [Marinobacter persicus]|uniref:Multisubunit potassium/proton antiporter, PhaA subunit /multisubunit potassium/proton antiporter, PhaB subunit n=1 Tax=Marinobacter persicus TaxID=930118 RepID=A0A1I3PYP7_9GAMM|nr:monovalent cation/H+ antiporter subunit A [Marinobacter persicus]GHD51949.1 monovalent cation/H+ antiporter subunit A [Marinobacter persicus]SFJ26331.1 multisubunit potassium/proton antiporter, PhaA subunit /multisubunit potassium/proton antiporter, PhaB subunit [Marinobacter persicus]
MSLPLVVFLPFLGAIAAPLFAQGGRTAIAIASSVPALIALAALFPHWETLADGGTVLFAKEWLPAIGISFTFRLDGLALLFSLLILIIGLLIILYARYYLKKGENIGKFYALLLCFKGSMLGIVLSGNLLLMVIFWELTSITSFLLISFWNHKQDARRGARMALAVTGGGGLALLAGILIIGNIVGSFELDDVLAAGDVIKAHAMYPVALTLVLLGAFTKSAQFPFHFWLPHAMQAPTPVSAYLHSATMVKAGVFLMARLYPALAGTELWFYMVSFTGMATLLIGAYVAMFKHDLKGLLAHSTVSHLGLITLLFGMGTELSAVAAVFHIINHATFKASLFMAAGIIDHETGTRDMRRLNGLWRYMPHTATLAMVAAASMAGVPLMNGFLSKEMFFAESLKVNLPGAMAWLLPVGATAAGIFAVAYSARFIHDVFFNGKPTNLPVYPPHEPPRYMKIPVEILVFACLMVGMFPAFSVGPLLYSASYATLGGAVPDYHLAILHGFNLPLMMSVAAFVGGLLMYSQRQKFFAFHARFKEIDEKAVFENVVTWLVNQAHRFTSLVENGSLQRYAMLLVVSVIAVAIVPLAQLGLFIGESGLSPVDWPTGIAAAVLIVSAIGAAMGHRERFSALVLLSVVGLVVALAFARFSAPDLAMTQLSVETVTIVLLMLALFYMPSWTPIESGSNHRIRDVILALIAGVGMTLVTLAMLTQPFTSISEFFLENSKTGGGGTNVVNVILVDFRGFDTLGEITVLAIAALGIYAMLKDTALTPPPSDGQGHAWTRDAHPLMLKQLARPLLPLALMVSAYIFLRGHNLPGGGFIAGLITSVALVVQYIACGMSWTQDRISIKYHNVIGLGLLFATLAGVGSFVFGYPFLTSTFEYLKWPVVGKFEIASAIVFDLGVYLAVIGATLLALVSIGRLSPHSAIKSPQEKA